MTHHTSSGGYVRVRVHRAVVEFNSKVHVAAAAAKTAAVETMWVFCVWVLLVLPPAPSLLIIMRLVSFLTAAGGEGFLNTSTRTRGRTSHL